MICPIAYARACWPSPDKTTHSSFRNLHGTAAQVINTAIWSSLTEIPVRVKAHAISTCTDDSVIEHHRDGKAMQQQHWDAPHPGCVALGAVSGAYYAMQNISWKLLSSANQSQTTSIWLTRLDKTQMQTKRQIIFELQHTVKRHKFQQLMSVTLHINISHFNSSVSAGQRVKRNVQQFSPVNWTTVLRDTTPPNLLMFKISFGWKWYPYKHVTIVIFRLLIVSNIRDLMYASFTTHTEVVLQRIIGTPINLHH